MPHLHRIAGVVIVAAVALGLILPRLHAAPHRAAGPVWHAVGPPRVGPGRLTGAGGAAERTVNGRPATAAPAAEKALADELGEVPILMYHRILAKPLATLDRTPAEMTQELTRLARENYIPITAADYVSGRIDLPLGAHPVVLTFDDGGPGQFAFDAQGNPAADSAAGLILAVARQYPRFRPVATFFVNADPFGLGPRASAAVRWLTAHGFEVANHTTHHLDLAQIGKARTQREIGTDQRMIEDMGAPAPTTFAFPYGALTRQDLPYVRKGQAGGASWDFGGMFLAGWKPAQSPFGTHFNPMLIDRIRSDGRIKDAGCVNFCSTAWLDWLDKNPDARYTSDGDPGTITYPAVKRKLLLPRYRALGREY